MSWVSVNTSRGHEEGISASFVALLEMRAAAGGASVRDAVLGVPHGDESIRARRACHKNSGVQL